MKRQQEGNVWKQHDRQYRGHFQVCVVQMACQIVMSASSLHKTKNNVYCIVLYVA